MVSGLLRPGGPPGQILDLALEGTLELVVDDRIMSEYRAVLNRPELGIRSDDVTLFLEFADIVSTHLVALPLHLKLPHPADAMFVEVARTGKVGHLVTGNLRHFPRIPEGISARAFLDTFRKQSP